MSDQRLRQLNAELELEQVVHSLTIHELGNPLQSLMVLVELARDELRVAGSEQRSADRLDRALASIEQLRHALLRSTAVRASLRDPARVPSWGALLDSLGEFAAEQLGHVRARLVRQTAEIDAYPVVPDTSRAATMSALVGACTQVRAARQRDLVVHLEGRVLREQIALRVAIEGPAGPIPFAEVVEASVHDLLATDTRARCQRDAGALVIWSAKSA